jgi:hypothetical protein
MEYFLTTIALPLATLLTVLAKVLTDYFQLKQARKDLATNTALTQGAKDAAAAAALKAQQAVTVAQNSAAETKETLNGRIDQMIQAAVSAALADARSKGEIK